MAREHGIRFKASPEFRHLEKSPVAFFCAEYALGDQSDQYAGGLGVLAADFLMQAAFDGLPFVALGLKYGGSDPEGFEPVMSPKGNLLLIEIPIQKRTVLAKAWVKKFKDSAYLFLLDSDVSENDAEDREITRFLYDPRFYSRLSEQMVLGIGGVRLLEKIGITPGLYHLNEGHTAFAGIAAVAEEARRQKSSFMSVLAKMKSKIVATKHTIFSGAGMYLRAHEFWEFTENYCREQGIDPMEIFSIGRYENDTDSFSTTRFALHVSCRQNGVSAIHAAFEKALHPDSSLLAITNGVYKARWQSLRFQSVSAASIGDAEIWRVKNELRQEMVSFANKASQSNLDKDTCTIVWARRFTAYKRPDVLLSDIAWLKKLCLAKRPVQFIISGRAINVDEAGKKVVEKLAALSKDASFKGKISFIPDYSLPIAEYLVRGADIWLNTPVLGKEACGTSGMKAGLNGALQMSVSDGWIDEVNWSGKGWVLPEENIGGKVYNFLEKEAAPDFYARDGRGVPASWVSKMKATIETVESRFGAERMLRDYVKTLYKLGS